MSSDIVIITSILLSIALVELGYYFFVTRKFVIKAVRATAKIVSDRRHQPSLSSIFIATISFPDKEGHIVTIEAKIIGASLSPPNQRVGTDLPILYNKLDPSIFIVDNWIGRLNYTMKRSANVILILITVGILILAFC